MQDRVYQTPVREVTDLKQRLIDTWHSLSQSIVDDAIDEWRKRLQAGVNEKEEILNTCYSNWTWTGCADKLDVLLDCATVMCNFGW